MAGQRAEAQAGGPVFALPGSLKVADAPYIALFVEADGATSALLAANPHPTEDEIRIGLSGNLCRCTGYDGIIKAVAQAAAD